VQAGPALEHMPQPFYVHSRPPPAAPAPTAGGPGTQQAALDCRSLPEIVRMPIKSPIISK
jgi:hypothetical protein